jgi:hypothetical protein
MGWIRTPGGKVTASLPLERIERRAGRPEPLISRPYLLDALVAALEAIAGIGVKLVLSDLNPARLWGKPARRTARSATSPACGRSR